MNRRDFLKSALTSCAVLTAADFTLPAAAAEQKNSPNSASRPFNFIFVLMDDLGYGDLGCYGHPIIKTPNIDRLATQGCRFSDFYVSSPMCSPTRAGCLTGRDPNRYGFKHVINTGMVNPNVQVPEVHHLPVNEPTFPRQLQAIGYRTATIGKWHLSLNTIESEPKPDAYGFTHYFIPFETTSLYHGPSVWSRNGTKISIPAQEWYPDLYVDEAISFIRSGTGPFYMNLWPFTPHVTEESRQDFRERYPNCTEAQKTYFGCITQMDEQLGRLFKFLDDSGLSDHTIVIFASDNGPEPPVNIFHHEQSRFGSTGSLRGAKHVIYEGGIRVPAIIRWPGMSAPGSLSAVPVSTLDLLPTLCSATGAGIPAQWQYDGADFRPSFTGQKITRPHNLYWQCEYSMHTFLPGWTSPPLALRKDNWKLMSDLEFKNVSLYNLDCDRSEQFSRDKEYPDLVNSMLAEMKTLFAQINGPYQKTAQYLNPEILKGKDHAARK
jgi:arylsulfatase A